MLAETKNFKPDELKCSCCGHHGVQQSALDKLQQIRDKVGRPLIITSAYRCKDHPAEAVKQRPGQHHTGVAFDIAVSNGVERMEIVQQALALGAKGVGVAKGFVHVDFRLTDFPVCWVY